MTEVTLSGPQPQYERPTIVLMSRRWLRACAFALGAMLTLAACGGGAADTTATDAPAETTAPAAEAETNEAADAAPVADSPLSGEFTTVSGQTIDLANFQGEDVVLWFWAPW